MEYPIVVKGAIKELASQLRDLMRSSADESVELPTEEECYIAVEETYADKLIESFNSGKLKHSLDIEEFVYHIFNEPDNYSLVLKFSAKATIIHANRTFIRTGY